MILGGKQRNSVIGPNRDLVNVGLEQNLNFRGISYLPRSDRDLIARGGWNCFEDRALVRSLGLRYSSEKMDRKKRRVIPEGADVWQPVAALPAGWPGYSRRCYLSSAKYKLYLWSIMVVLLFFHGVHLSV